MWTQWAGLLDRAVTALERIALALEVPATGPAGSPAEPEEVPSGR
ncbi:MAG TPA: hypothetical protein VEQ15_00315 [Myxococcales bacterium]|nr:hypothetical protein [Myxococcales bacterium]